MKSKFLLVAPMALALTLGCAQKEPEGFPERSGAVEIDEPLGTISVFTVNYPLQYFAERIGGEWVEVSFPSPTDVDPAFWSPGPETVAAYQQADMILLNGLGYAKWLERATLPTGKLVDTSSGLEDRRIPLEEGPVHSHGPEGEHSHKGYAFTTWLDPQLAIEQARSVAQAVTGALPAHEEQVQSALEALIADLEDLDKRLELEAQRIGDQPLLFSHPVYQYFAARYGLNSRAVHWEPGENPTEKQWQELTTLLEDHPARWMIWEGEPLPATVERLADLGVQSVVYLPSANRPAKGDLLSVMDQNVASMQSIESLK